MDVKRKTNNNMKARMNIPFFNHYMNMDWFYNESQITKSKASFALYKNVQLLV